MRPCFVQDVERFQRKFGFTLPTEFVRLEDDLHTFRANFLDEELQEFIDACNAGDVELALDSLIDLVYIVCGTVLFHGIDTDEFYEATLDNPSVIFPTFEPWHSRPAILTERNWKHVASYIQQCILAYRSSQRDATKPLALKYRVLFQLSMIYITCMDAAAWMGVDEELFQLLWDDVQRANMAKERATRDDQSKRGSAAFDIIKPDGWVPPNGALIVKEYFDRNPT